MRASQQTRDGVRTNIPQTAAFAGGFPRQGRRHETWFDGVGDRGTYLKVVVLVQLPSVEGSHSLLGVLGVHVVDESETLRPPCAGVKGVRDSVLCDSTNPAENLVNNS